MSARIATAGPSSPTLLFALLATSLAACGSPDAEISANDAKRDDTSASTPGAPSSPVANGNPEPGAVEPPPPPCDEAQTEAIKTRFASAEAAPVKIDAVAIVRDRSCGERFFTRGPSQYQAGVIHLLGSNTKTYVASLALLLADDGLITLDDPIAKWIAGVPGGDAIRVRHLLNHGSGLADYGGSLVDMLSSFFGTVYTPEQLVTKAFGKPVLFQAGASIQYSNTNYILLGIIAEKATGEPLETLIRERILVPIGATSTFYRGKEKVVGDVAVGKTFLGNSGAAVSPSYYGAAGAYAGTPGDLAKWVEARGGGKFHSAKANAELFAMVDPKIEGITFGAGIMRWAAPALHLTGNAEAFGHPGLIMGYYSYGIYYPQSKTTVVVIADSDDGPKGPAPLNGFTSYLDPLYFAVTDPLFGYVAPAK